MKKTVCFYSAYPVMYETDNLTTQINFGTHHQKVQITQQWHIIWLT